MFRSAFSVPAVWTRFGNILIELRDFAFVHVPPHLGGPDYAFRLLVKQWVDHACISVDFPAFLGHVIACVPAPLCSVPGDGCGLEGQHFKALVWCPYDVY